MTQTSEESRAPYKLFDFYTFEDRDLFFGREEEVLRTVGEVLSTRLLVLFAPSGSGKSSLINAGVRPRLEERGFATITIRLDCEPDLAIKRQLREKFPQPFATLTDETDLLTGLRTAYAPKADQSGFKPLVVFIDQFEEFFIIFRDKPEVRRVFVKQVAQIKFDSSLPVYLVLSLRDDYFVNLNEFREEIPSIFHNNANIQLRPLNDQAALRAIVEPARKFGVQFEDGLPKQITRDLKAVQAGTVTGSSVRAVSTHRSNHAAETIEGGCGLKDLPQETHADGGVLPITLQIVCHNLWQKRPENQHQITSQQYEANGGATNIIRNQLDQALGQIPRTQIRLMRRLFRVLMTADLTKRLRSVEDLSEILNVPDNARLRSLLENLTNEKVLRVEHIKNQAWYEFSHDYLVGEVAAWLARFESRLRRRHRIYAWVFGLLPAIALASFIVWNFFSFEVQYTSVQYSGQQEELQITRRLNPFGFHVTKGFRKDEVTDLEARNKIARGYRLRFARPKDWQPITELLSGFKAAAIVFIIDGQPKSYSSLVASIETDDHDVSVAAFFAQKDPSLLEPLVQCFKSSNTGERLRGIAVLVKLENSSELVVEALTALLKDSDPNVLRSAAEAIGKLGQKRSDWTDERMIDLLQDNLSSWRQTAGLVLSGRQTLSPTTYEKIMALRNDSRPWVRIAAWDALLQIENSNRISLTLPPSGF
jgi:hypothetical protein